MLNTKYFIVPTEEGLIAQRNPNANGNAWFVENVELVPDANAAILALGDLDTKKTAVVNEKFREELEGVSFSGTAEASIELTEYQPNRLTYEYTAEKPRLALFSEVYYPEGWKVFIDGKKATHFRADYVLRAMVVPAGTHSITFHFDPEVVKTGSSIALASSIVLGILLLGGLFLVYKRK